MLPFFHMGYNEQYVRRSLTWTDRKSIHVRIRMQFRSETVVMGENSS